VQPVNVKAKASDRVCLPEIKPDFQPIGLLIWVTGASKARWLAMPDI
jgi:hypothetical protein